MKPSKRNYAAEAKELIRKLSSDQMYRLYAIVVNEQKRHQTEERDAELQAVKVAIEMVPRLDPDRLAVIRRGYRSEMAANARAEDGNTKHNKKKA